LTAQTPLQRPPLEEKKRKKKKKKKRVSFSGKLKQDGWWMQKEDGRCGV